MWRYVDPVIVDNGLHRDVRTVPTNRSRKNRGHDGSLSHCRTSIQEYTFEGSPLGSVRF